MGTPVNDGHCLNCGEMTFPTDNGWAYEPFCSKICEAQYPGVGVSAGSSVLPTDSEERKEIPIFSGVLNYFPLAIAAVARISRNSAGDW